MFEHMTARVLPLPRFFSRLARSFLWAAATVSAALSLGVVGYHHVAGLAWTDALLEASMILTGMGRSCRCGQLVRNSSRPATLCLVGWCFCPR